MSPAQKKQPKRILIFSLTYFPFVGGAEVAVKEITDRISRDDIQFDMITLRFSRDLPAYERVGKVHVHRIGFTLSQATVSDTFHFPLSLNKYLFPFLAYAKARALHAKCYYDAFWSIQANYAGFAALFTKWALPHVRFILTLQEGDPLAHYKRRVGLLYPLYKRIFQKADMVQTISHYLAGAARDMGYRGPLEVVPNGVDVSHFSRKPLPDDLAALRARLKKKDKERYVVTVSRLVKKNAVDDILRALSHLPKTVKLIVVGAGPDGETLWKLANTLRVESRVWFAGHVPHEDLPAYLQLSDVFVRPSRSEGMGNVFVEAMAAGVPVIATPVGGIVDFVFDPVRTDILESETASRGTNSYRHLGKVTPTGLLCNVEDPKDIAKQVRRILGDEKLRARIVKNASEMVKKKYDWWTIATTMRESVFGKMVQ